MALGTTGISTTAVAQAIGVGSSDVGTLCSHSNINKWAKFKPVSYASTGNIYGATGTDTTVLASVNYGLSATSSTSYETASSTGWVYTRPSGNASSPYRLGDFRGYNHAAQAPMILNNNDVTINMMYANTYEFVFMQSNGSGGGLTLSDLPTIGNYYLGVVLSGTAGTYPITSPTTLSNGGGSVSLNLAQAPFNSWTNQTMVCRTLCFQNIRTQGSALGTNTYYPAPVDNVAATRTINFIRTVGLSGYCDKVSNDSAPTFYFMPLAQYQAYPPGGSPTYFPTNGALFFELDLTNTTEQNITIPVSKLSLSLDRTFKRTTPVSVAATIYYNGSKVTTSIEIPVGQTRKFIVGHASVLGFDPNNTYIDPSPSDTTAPVVVLKYDSSHTVKSFGLVHVVGT